MEILIVIAVVIVGVAVAIALIQKPKVASTPDEKAKPEYVYTKKQFIMSKAENDFYQALQQAVGSAYMIYPQAHLSLFLDHTTKGQSWKGALSTIQRKSVDFLICNREYYNPLVAIELDDASHQREDRSERDAKVEQICQSAGMPLVRFRWQSQYDVDDILPAISPYLH